MRIRRPRFRPFVESGGGSHDGDDLRTSLAAWWSMDEASGNRADSHTNGYTLTDENTVTTATAVVGANAALFDDANTEKLTRANGAEAWHLNTADFTIAAWVKFTAFDTGAPQMIFSTGGSTNTNEGHEVGVDAVGQDSYIQMSNGTTRIRDTTTPFDIASPLATATWYYFIWEFDRSANVTIMVNDSAQSSFAMDISSQSADDIAGSYELRLGTRASANGRFLNGALDEVAIWNRVLTSAEKTWLYNSGSGRAYSETI